MARVRARPPTPRTRLHARARRDTGEAIEVLALPLADAQGFMDDAALPKSAGLLFGLLWLRSHKLGAPAGPPQARLDGAWPGK